MFSIPLTISFKEERFSTDMRTASNETSVGPTSRSNLKILIKAFMHLSVMKK